MSINHEITQLLRCHGCNLVGFADLRELPAQSRMRFDVGILIALPFTKEAMRENKNGAPQRYYAEHAPMTQRLGELKQLTVDFLESQGYEALADTPASVVDNNSLRSLLPQKTVATLAGIGWIGKCAMLVTKEFGSALRLTVVLTNAPLDCAAPVTASQCGDCRACVDVCPGGAPLGGQWEVAADRDEFFDAHACRRVARARAKQFFGIDESLCGLCVSHCPYTKQALGYD